MLATARFGSALDYTGPNLASNQLVVYPPSPRTVPGSGTTSGPPPRQGPGARDRIKEQKMRKAAPALSATQVSAATATAHAIAAALGASDIIRLEAAYATLQHAAAGPNWASSVYVATPQLLRAFGIMPSQVSPTADILTMRPGLSTLSKMQLLYGTPPCVNSSAGCPPGPGGDDTLPCVKGHCVNNPVIQEVSALPSGTSAPNTVITARLP